MMKLVIGNKNYSSWSLRGWLALRAFNIPFEEELMLLNGPGWKRKLYSVSGTGTVPVLMDGDLVVPDSLAIIEYLAEKFPEKAYWPDSIDLRARARSVACEMHAGFLAVRNQTPMNLRKRFTGFAMTATLSSDLRRLEDRWTTCLSLSGGPYLFGEFGAVDIMFTPVAARLRGYDLEISDTSGAYVDRLLSHPAFLEWEVEALKEHWIVPEDEVDI